MYFSISRFLVAAAACLTLGAYAQNAPVEVSNAWVRATVPGQGGSGAFMTLQAQQDLQLVGASSPAAGVAQVHEMKLEDNTMHMRPIPALALPAHQSVALTPQGNHIMLMDLKQVLTTGSTIEVTLQLKDASGKTLTQVVNVPVRQNSPSGMAMPASHGHSGS